MKDTIKPAGVGCFGMIVGVAIMWVCLFFVWLFLIWLIFHMLFA